MSNIRSGSRKDTPWTGKEDATAVEKFIDRCNHSNYYKKHPRAGSEIEREMLNSFRPERCRHCGSELIKVHGYTATGIRRYKCRSCGKTFTPITGTIFDQRKIPITEWLDFLITVFSYGSFRLTSKSNRNAYNTTRFWMEKVFLLLKSWQDRIILAGRVFLDETYYSLRGVDNERDPEGKLPRGLSRNKMCIGTAWDGRNLVCVYEGQGKPSMKHTLQAFSSHISHGSVLIHDGDNSHSRLVSVLGLSEEIHTTAETKGRKDSENPLHPINMVHKLLKRFLNAHSGFIRDDIQDYLNLFSFMMSEPDNIYEKVEILLNLALSDPKTLRYRDKIRE